MLKIDDTIVAIATPFAESGIGVLRLSGPESLAIAQKLTSFHKKDKFLKDLSSHTIHHGWIKNNDDIVDDVLISIFKKPSSYTGEDVVEISCHGSPVVLKKILQLCLDHGARHAKPGEFTERAYLNGKCDLAQAEAVAQLIHANSDSARQEAQNQLKGVLSKIINELRASLVSITAHLEANLDFVEEDIPNVSRKEIAENLKKVSEKIKSLLSTSLRGKILREGIRVALVGQPNVGKSSLFNALLSSSRAIVTDIPGTTRDTLEERLEWNGYSIILTDTAGLRETSDAVEQEGKQRSKDAIIKADVVLLIIDGSKGFSREDEIIFREIDRKKLILVVNKIDLGEKEISSDLFELIPVVKVSAKSGQGLSGLCERVVQFGETPIRSSDAGSTITNLRHVQLLEESLKKVQQALSIVEKNKSEEMLSVDLHEALRSLGQITGDNISEEILSSIFSQFCIGK